MNIDTKSPTWKQVNLHGSAAISRLWGEYVIHDVVRIPSTKYRIKVFEREDDFLALPNLGFRNPDGSVESTSGLGTTAVEALQDAIARVGEILASRPICNEEDIEWIDARDF